MAVLDTALVLRAANLAFEKAVHRGADELLGGDLFRLFPPNPAGVDHSDHVRRAMGRVLATESPQHLVFLRYDIPSSQAADTFIEKYWVPVYAPIFDRNGLVGIQIYAHDVTSADEHVRNGLAIQRDMLSTNLRTATPHHCLKAPPVPAAGPDPIDDDCRQLANEAEHLRRALESRATIDQAKGILMAEHGCGAREAFQVLVATSQSTNRKLRSVAAEIVAQGSSREWDIAV